MTTLIRAAAIVVACLGVAWVMTARGPARNPSARLREFGSCAALIILTVAVAVTGSWHGWLAFVLPAAVVAGSTLLPRLAARVLPGALIVFGLYGLQACRVYAQRAPLFAVSTLTNLERLPPFRAAGLAPKTFIAWPESLVLLLAGSWLLWRLLRRQPRLAARVLGRAWRPDGGTPPALLLLPVALITAELMFPGAWMTWRVAGTGLAIAATVGSLLVVRRAPEAAATLATIGLAFLGLASLFIARRWAPYDPWAFNGLLAVSAHTIALAGYAQGAAFLALTAVLVPRTILPLVRPRLRRLADAELTQRVERLTETRAVVVDAAAAELRRLERDLHDGAQGQLVALGMTLRAAERLVTDDPRAALAVIGEARQASARALSDLRNLVRGIYPPVLADRGLADAVRALALDLPVRTRVRVELAGRPSAPVEAACYFAVAEALTNVVKHADARNAEITIRHESGALRIAVADDGAGGADPRRGMGLAGLESRLAAFDGVLAVSSPPGGPTIVAIEVPCALLSQKISSC